MKRVALVTTGSRRLTYEKHGEAIREGLKKFRRSDIEQVIVYEGDWEGCDKIVYGISRELGFDVQPIPYFKEHGKAGGPIRNKCMVDLAVVLGSYGYAMRGLAYPDAESVGTVGCVKYGESRGIRFDVRMQ